jgi:aspartokinase/homoserine dehydrogenase 1
MTTLVMKFGGSSVGTTTALMQVLSIVLYEREQWDRLILVVSALDGVTDMLIEAAHLAQLGNQRGYRRIIANLRTRHLALIDELPLGTTERTALQADIDRLLFDMLDIYQSMGQNADDTPVPDRIDATIGVGERLAARIIAALLRQNDLRSVAIDATSLIITDEAFGNATPNIDQTRELVMNTLLPMLDRNIIPVVTGFIGSTPKGKPTTMGRGGSDLTASVLSVCTKADETWIWTAVDGMMSADPREVPGARVIPTLSYEEVAELAYFGARILHARMVSPLRAEQIPLRVKNVYKPQQAGTLIHRTKEEGRRSLKAVTSISGLGLTAEHSGSLSAIAAIVDERLFASTHAHADVMISSQSSTRSFVCFLIPTSAGPDAIHSAQSAVEEYLHEQLETQEWQVNPVSIITVIGDRLDEQPELAAAILQALAGTTILGLAQGPSHCTLSVVVDPKEADEALQVIHEFILSSG